MPQTFIVVLINSTSRYRRSDVGTQNVITALRNCIDEPSLAYTLECDDLQYLDLFPCLVAFTF